MMRSILPLLLVALATTTTLVLSATLEEDFERIKHSLVGLEFDEAHALFARAKRTGSPKRQQHKINHMVVLFVENRACDHIFGCMLGDQPGFDGIPTRKDGSQWKMFPAEAGTGDGPSPSMVNVSCGTAKLVCKSGTKDLTTRMFSGDQLPIKKAISENFAVFNKMFTAVPGPSWPNHLFAQSATSCGTSSNVMWNQCGGTTAQFPQMTIYDSLAMANVPFGIYVNDTCGPTTSTPCGSVAPGWGINNITQPNASTGLDPDVTMMGVARHKNKFFSHSLFYEQAAAGTLPAFSWISPAHEAADHPCMDLAKGERQLKDIYEAVRNGKNWNNTLLVVTYDDYGGFYDHVKRPNAPNDESPCNVWNKQHNVSKDGNTSCPSPFDFQKLGLRSSTMLISPWIEKGSIINEPKSGPNTGGIPSQWDHTSMLATAKNLFSLPGFLTKRDAWAGSFDELFLDVPRTDAGPVHLPSPPQNATPWGPPHSGAGADDDDDDDDDGGEFAGAERSGPIGRRRLNKKKPRPQHCSASLAREGKKSCLGVKAVTAKQRKLIELYAILTMTPQPNVGSMDNNEAGKWLKARWMEYMAMLPE